jgi:hypothetical protein
MIAGFKDGKAIHELVPARPLDGGAFEILSSPGFAPGFARGDIVRACPEEKLGYVVEKRGGYVCVQAFFTGYTPEQIEGIVGLVQEGYGVMEGGLDRPKGRLLIFAFPISVGFPSIEKIMRTMEKKYPLDQWLYGNVFDTKDGKTPLNWWI